jgi:hypothetical protein
MAENNDNILYMEKNDNRLPNIYRNIPSFQKSIGENIVNFNKILNEIPKDEENTCINYEGLRKHYLKSHSKKNKFIIYKHINKKH